MPMPMPIVGRGRKNWLIRSDQIRFDLIWSDRRRYVTLRLRYGRIESNRPRSSASRYYCTKAPAGISWTFPFRPLRRDEWAGLPCIGPGRVWWNEMKERTARDSTRHAKRLEPCCCYSSLLPLCWITLGFGNVLYCTVLNDTPFRFVSFEFPTNEHCLGGCILLE